MLTLKGLSVNYGMLEAVKDVSLEVPEGKVVSLLGANGSGKSTILKTVSGLKAPREGEMFLGDTKLNDMAVDEIVTLGISHIPEGRRLFPYMTVLENLNLGAYTRSGKKEAEDIREEIFERFPNLKRRAGTRAGPHPDRTVTGRLGRLTRGPRSSPRTRRDRRVRGGARARAGYGRRTP